MSQGPEIHQIEVNSTAASVSRPTPESIDSTAYRRSRGAMCEWWRRMVEVSSAPQNNITLELWYYGKHPNTILNVPTYQLYPLCSVTI
jgi:hypothetical protein